MKNKSGPMCVVAATFLLSAGAVLAQTGAGPAAKLDKAALSDEVKNDQRLALAPAPGKKFLWVSTTLSSAQAVDLTKVVLTSGGEKTPLIGVDSVWGGDPKQFSMVAPARAKDGRALEPLEETRSDGSVSFAFSPGKAATLKVLRPPQTVCLLFSVPQAFRTGEISGLDAKALPLPALSAPSP